MTAAARITAGGLHVCFQRRGDRFAHFVEFSCQGDPAHRLLTSIEGAEDEAWPASPALQNLHIEERTGGVQVALLVGMAGRSHWSLSVEAKPENREIIFDAACRAAAAAVFLGSSYEVAQEECQRRPAAALWQLPRGEVCLELLANAAAEQSALAWSLPRRIAIQVDTDSAGKMATYRWRYRLWSGHLSA